MLEAETIIIHRLAQDSGCRPFRIEVGIAAGKSLKNLWGPPPAALAVFRLAEGLVDHLHQIDGPLVWHVLFYQRLYLVILQPEPLSTIKQMQGLGIELAMVQVVCEVDVLASRNAHADEAAGASRINQRLQLISGTDERGIAPVLLDGLAVRRTELHIARRQQVLQHNLLRIWRLVELVDIDERERSEGDVGFSRIIFAISLNSTRLMTSFFRAIFNKLTFI